MWVFRQAHERAEFASVLALFGSREMSDLSRQRGATRTLIGLLWPIAIL
jgi:hypothetical protein